MRSKNTSAFTLVELLIGITIISIVFGVGIASYREFSRRQALTGVSKQLKADIRLIQQLALTGQKPENVSCPTLNGYTFSRVNSTVYTLSANCSNASGAVMSPIEIKSVDLGTDITLTATVPNMLFKVLGQGTDLASANSLLLTHTSGNDITITVGVGGDVR